MPPPLAKDLFDDLYRFHPVFANVPHEIASSFRTNFELGMSAYVKHNNGNVMEFQRELGRYFLQFEPGPKNLYAELIALLRGKNIQWSTTNYDLLIEIAGARCGLQTTHYGPPQANAQNTLNLLKIHGSCNFWPDIGTNRFIDCTFEGNATDIAAPVKCVPPDEAKRLCMTENSLSPALAIFAEGKQVKICPDFVKQQLVAWQTAVLKTTRIIAVGTRPNFDDVHIWEYIGKSPAAVYFVGGAPEADSLKEYRKHHYRSARTYHIGERFNEAMLDIRQLMRI